MLFRCSLLLCLAELGLNLATVSAQDRPVPGAEGSQSILQRFDTNGDGKIDDQERRAARSKMQQMQNRPGARTPSGETQTVSNRLITEMEYRSSDGQMIPCVLSIPIGEGPYPILVTIHGGQGNRDLGYIRSMAAPNNLSPTIHAFNDQSWAILAISYRSGNGALFGMEQEDVIAGIRFAKSLPKIDPNRVGVVGGSHGGHLALVAAEKMGREFLCVAVGSPWMTDPIVYMMGDPNQPPLSRIPAKTREDLMANGKRILGGMRRGRQMSDQELLKFLQEHSIEANSQKITIPTLFITSRGDDQAPHVLIEPMIERMKSGGQDVRVYTAEKSPHGFYWARTVSAARDLRGAKTPQEEQEEQTARSTIIGFFQQQFAREDARTDPSPQVPKSSAEDKTQSDPANDGIVGKKDSASRNVSPQDARGIRDSVRGAGMPRGGPRGEEKGVVDFKSLADPSGKISKEAFQRQFSEAIPLASRAEIIDRLFSRLDADGDGSLNETEFEAYNSMRRQMGQGGNRGGMRGGRGGGGGEGRAGRGRRVPPSQNPNAPAKEPPKDDVPLASINKTAPVRTANGQLVGEQKGDIRIFRGVPYAAAPVEDNRWRIAGPPDDWAGIRDAIRFGAPSLQGETFLARSLQSEDCLFLNIWTPSEADETSKLPVLLWIHGGAFIQGSGAQPRYDGSELARRGAVVITINYRLGPMGLFAHPTLTAEAKPDAPLGNYCLLDMMTALRWTQKNIAAFGGDPMNVTISGSSAGGTSCLFLMGIPEAKGLFHRAIIHSSGGIRNIQTLAQAEAAGMRLAEHLGLRKDASATDLRRAAAADLAVGVGILRQLELPVKPIIDGRLVTGSPSEVFAQGSQLRIPVMIGGANGESGARKLSDEVSTGGAFGFQRELAEKMHRAGQPVWMFQLTFVPPQARNSRSAAQHGESVAYAFGTIGPSGASRYGFHDPKGAENAMRSRRVGGAGNPGGGSGREDDSQPVEESEQGRKISAAMIDYWLAFMKEGTPRVEHLPQWPNYSPESPETMVFGNEGISVR